MRTTVTIDDELLTRAKIEAATSKRTLGQVVDDALRMLLTERATGERSLPVELRIFGSSAVQPGVDLEDTERMAELLGDNVFRPG